MRRRYHGNHPEYYRVRLDGDYYAHDYRGPAPAYDYHYRGRYVSDRVAFDAGEPEARYHGQRWRRYLDEIDRARQRIRHRQYRAEEEAEMGGGPGRRFARRYKEPIVGAALAGAALPLALGGGPQAAPSGPQTEPISHAALAGRPIPKGSVEEDVGHRLASLKESRIREATIDGAMTAYGITRALAEQIHDIAVSNNIEPELAFGLVKTESAFDHRAVSNVGARGLTQVMPRTARWLRPGTTIEDLYNRRLNLDMGFGYLRDLIDKYNGNVRLALLAYNRGPGTVDRVLDRGGDPDNGYADLVLEGYTDLG